MANFYDSFVGGQRNALARQATEQDLAHNALLDQQYQQSTDAKQTLAETEWALQSPDPVAAVKSLPHIAQAWQQHGIDINTLDPDHARAILTEGRARAASALGVGPPQETFGTAQTVTIPGADGQQPTNALAQIGSGGTVRTIKGALPYDPEKFGSPQDIVYGGKPTVAQIGNRGTIRPIPEAAPYNRPSTAGGPPAGYKLNPDGTMAFIPGGPADPNKPQPTNFSGREAQMFQRVLSSAAEANAALQNIMELPQGASSGWLGVGASPGTGIFSSIKGVLVNKASDQEVQDYESMMPGLGRALSTIETAGLAPNGALINQMGKLDLRQGDTGYTILHKLAEYRQIIEKGIETNLDNPRIPKEQKAVVQKIIDDIRAAVPFTHHDVTELQRRQADNPDLTMAQLAKEKGVVASPATVPTATGPNGEKIQLINGQWVPVK